MSAVQYFRITFQDRVFSAISSGEAGGFCFFHYSFHGNRMEQLCFWASRTLISAFFFGDFFIDDCDAFFYSTSSHKRYILS